MATFLNPEKAGLVKVDRPAGGTPVPLPPSTEPYSAALVPNLQTVTDTLAQAYKGTALVRYAPIPASGDTAANAAANSAAQTIVDNSSSGSGISSVSLAMPPQYSVSGSPGAVLAVSWVAEPSGTVLQSPPPGLGSYEGTATNFLDIALSSNNAISVTATPATSSSLALATRCDIGEGTASTPAGWSATATVPVYYQTVSSASPVTVAFGSTGEGSAMATLSLFSGPAPSFVHSTYFTTGSTPGSPQSFSALSNTAGNTLVIVVYIQVGSYVNHRSGPLPLSISDSLGNPWTQILSYPQNVTKVGTGSDWLQTTIFVCANCASGSNTVSVALDSGVGVSAIEACLMEFGPLTNGSFIPFFAPLSISLNTGGVNGVLSVANGGTGGTTFTTHGVLIGENSSTIKTTAAGTAGQILTSNGSSADPTFQSLSLFSVALTGQTGTIAATNLVASPVATALYEVSYYLNDTTAGTSGTVSVTISWNDGASQSVTSANVTFGTLGAYVSGTIVVKATSGAIQYATTVTSAVGSPAYSLDLRAKQLT